MDSPCLPVVTIVLLFTGDRKVDSQSSRARYTCPRPGQQVHGPEWVVTLKLPALGSLTTLSAQLCFVPYRVLMVFPSVLFSLKQL